MLTLDEFKKRYAKEIDDYLQTESEIRQAYDFYLEDPMQFHPDQISNFSTY